MGMSIDIVLGAIFVVVYAGDRFNTPPTNRSSTTAARFLGGTTVYCAFAVAVYGVLLNSPHLLDVALAHVDRAAERQVHAWEQRVPTPLLISVLLTVLLPRVPVLSSIDGWIRSRIQRVAAIPFEVRRLSAELRRLPFSVPAPRRTEVEGELRRADFELLDLTFDDDGSPQYLWTKISTLVKSLEDWEASPRFSRFVNTFSHDFSATELSAIRGAYKAMTPKARTCFRLLSDHSTEMAAKHYVADFVEEARSLSTRLYEFVARAVLHCEHTHGARLEQLRTLGFEGGLAKTRLTLNQSVALFMALSMLFVLGFVMTGWFGPTGEPELSFLVLLRAMMISATYIVAVWCAIYPKETWESARRSEFERPWAWYLVSAVTAAAFGLVVNFAFRLVMHLDLHAAAADFWQSRPWTLMTFTTAFVLAFLADDRAVRRLSPARLRVVEGLVMAVAAMTTARAVHLLLPMTGARIPPLAVILTLSGIIGFYVGVLVPTLYREAPRWVPVPTDDTGDRALAGPLRPRTPRPLGP
jgi:hypothetical protein